jgi:hypothetical protein
VQSNATHSFFVGSSFNGDGDYGFALSAPTAFTGSGSTDEKLVHFHAPR